jgi:hypothetical protein
MNLKIITRKLLTICLTLPLLASGQDKYMFSNKLVDLQFLYNYRVPSGAFGKTYGAFSSVGTGAMFKTKNNWVVSGELNYLFGKEIKEVEILNNLLCSGGYIGSINGAPANYSVFMRGIDAYVKVGRVFGFNKRNMNSGIFVQGGIGYIQHKIKLTPHDNDIPQLDADYVKGYDRLSSGIAFNEFVGYIYHSRNRFVNLYFGLDLMQAQTYNRRTYNYDQASFDLNKKIDYSTSFRFGWMIPIYLNTREENEFQFR